MSYVLELPPTLEQEIKEYLPKESIISLIKEEIDKAKRQRKREQLLANTPADIANLRGIITEQDIANVQDDRFQDLMKR